MKIYNKYLKTNNQIDEMTMIGKVSNFVKIVSLINDLISLKNEKLSKKELDKKVSKILKRSEKMMKKYNIDKIYRDMIQCGINSSLKNLNYNI